MFRDAWDHISSVQRSLEILVVSYYHTLHSTRTLLLYIRSCTLHLRTCTTRCLVTVCQGRYIFFHQLAVHFCCESSINSAFVSCPACLVLELLNSVGPLVVNDLIFHRSMLHTQSHHMNVGPNLDWLITKEIRVFRIKTRHKSITGQIPLNDVWHNFIRIGPVSQCLSHLIF